MATKRGSTGRAEAASIAAPDLRLTPEADALNDILDGLTQRVDLLADRMLTRYQAVIPAYRSLPEQTLLEIRAINVSNISGFIDAMRARRGPGEEQLEAIRSSAVKRVREGVPLSALLSAYRVGAQLAWTEAREIAGTEDAERLAAGMELASGVMAWVDEVSGAVAQAYLEEYERISSDREAARRDFIDGLVGGELTPNEIRARAEALGLDPDAAAGVAIIAVDHDEGDGSDVRAVQHELRAMLAEVDAGRTVDTARGNEIIVLYQSADEDRSTAAALAAELRPILARARAASSGVTLHAGVGRLRDALEDLAGSHREASIAITAARAGSSAPVALYGEVVVEELILRERSVSRRLAQILEPLDEYPDLRQTLLEYIEHGPGLPAVARRLFLHPNTVAYRLSRIRELTGRDPKTPAGISELYLALRASQLIGG